MNEVDGVRVALGYVAGSRRASGASKGLQLQVVTADSGAHGTDARFGTPFVAWCLIAPPAPLTRDPEGALTGACSALVAEGVVDRPVLGTFDPRVAPYGQDAKPGDTVLTNFYGSRLFLGKDNVAINAGGGFLNFDLVQKKLTISSIPAKAGGSAPYLSADSTQIGFVSGSGAASVNVSGGVATVSGASVALDSGSVAIGQGASEPMVLHSLLVSQFAVLCAWLLSHVHVSAAAGSPTSPPVVPISLSPFLGSLRVKTA